MADISHQCGSDLTLGPTGDLAVVSGTTWGQQRVLRRLLTGPGDYIWQLDYGAGLGQFVGSPASPIHIRALVRSQIVKEAAVARSPEPSIEVEPVATGDGLYVHLSYTDNKSGETQPVTFLVGGS